MIIPVELSACRMPTEAEEDWMMPVTTAPTSTPKMGFWNLAKRAVNSGTSLRGATAASMAKRPVNRMLAQHHLADLLMAAFAGSHIQNNADDRNQRG